MVPVSASNPRSSIRLRLAHGGAGVLLLLGLTASGCSTVDSTTNSIANFMTGGGGPQAGQPGYVSGFLGGVAADEPRAALAGREVLSAGGNAADAAVAVGLMLSVTLPSRAGLGGGGACVAYSPGRSSVNEGVPEALLFVPGPGGSSGERPAAVPMLARGMYALSARYGQQPFESTAIAAEQAARFGVPASRAFIRDLSVVAGPLSGDPQARAVFFQPNGQPLAEAMTLQQPDLAATLSQLRAAGVGDLYSGTLARKLVGAAGPAGAGLTGEALRTGLPRWAPAITMPAPGNDQVAFLPPPADGGLAAAAAFRALMAAPDSLAAAEQQSLAVAAAWRAQGGVGNPEALLAGPVPAASPMPPLPASTGFVTLDKDGNAVACTLTMNNLFGTGRIAPGTGILLAASPTWAPPALLSAGVAWNANIHAFHAAVAASGQEAAPVAAADMLLQVLRAKLRVVSGDNSSSGPNAAPNLAGPVVMGGGVLVQPAPDPGRTNLVGCVGYLPGSERSCGWVTDPRGAGLAVGSN